jgi:hypothetical protein
MQIQRACHVTLPLLISFSLGRMSDSRTPMKILYLDDNVLVDFPSAFPHVEPKLLDQYAGNLDDIPGIFGLMRPMAHAVESFEELATLFDTYILSTSPWDNPTAWSDKLLWVKKYLGPASVQAPHPHTPQEPQLGSLSGR